VPADPVRLPEGTVAVLGFRDASSGHAGYDAVITIEDFDATEGLRLPQGRPHLVLRFDDLDFDDGETVVASSGDIGRALAFAREHRPGRILVHCQAGRCRSPAVALAIVADRLGPGREAEAVAELLRIRPESGPNLVALRVADAVLGRGGRLESAWLAHEEGDEPLARMRFLKRAAYERFPRR
jgi:predicted protein tyrosine phosphatase